MRCTRRRRRLELGLARRVELELGRVDDDVGAGELAQLAELGRRPRGLHRPAPAEHDDLADARAEIASIAASVVSVGASSSGVSASIRATSSATLPFPTTTARSRERSNSSSWKSGWPLYQATNSVAGHEPGRSSPGIPRRRSVCAPNA